MVRPDGPVRHRRGWSACDSTGPDRACRRRHRAASSWPRYVFGWYIPQFYESTTTYLWAEALYIGVAAMGLNLLTGYNGQVSIGHGAFFGIGMYTTAILMAAARLAVPRRPCPSRRRSAFAVGVLVGFPALRVKGLYLALVTLGLAVLFPRAHEALRARTTCARPVARRQVGELARVKLAPPAWVPSFIGAQRPVGLLRDPRRRGGRTHRRRAHRAQPVRTGADRGARPRGGGGDRRHQHRRG